MAIVIGSTTGPDPHATGIVGRAPAPTRLPPGLTSVEAATRAAAGRANVDVSRRRSDGDVVRENALTFFNLVLGSLILALLAIGEFRDGLFVGIVVMANIAAATIQELRATHQLESLVAITAPRATVRRDGVETAIPAVDVVEGDLIRLNRGDQIVVDGPVLEGGVEVDESLLTGESESVRKRPGDRLLSGSFAVAGSCYYQAERVGLESYALKLVSDARKIVKRASPLQLRFQRMLRVLLNATAVLAVALMISINVQQRGFAEALKATTSTVTSIVPEGLLLAMTVAFVIGAVRVARRGAIVQDIAAIEALNYVDVLCFDKTGTITANRLEVDSVFWAYESDHYLPWLAAFAVVSRDESGTVAAIADALEAHSNDAVVRDRVAFSSARRWSAVELERGGQRRVLVLGAPETVMAASAVGAAEFLKVADDSAAQGLRTAALGEIEALPAGDALPPVRPLALVTLRDVLRPEFRRTLETVEELGIAVKVISGDRPDTVIALLAQLGVTVPGGAIAGPELERLSPEKFAAAVDENSIFGRIVPAQKAKIIQALRDRGHYVAMVGDGANDVHALRAADVAVAMASGTATARAVAGVVLLHDSFEAFISATRESRFVLGNSARLSKLFITKSLYAYVIIIATSLLGLDFPFLPRHGTLSALLTLGIPALFISAGVPSPDAGRDFTRNVMRFALPASMALAVSAILVHLLTQGVLRREIDEARTLVSITIIITALVYMLQILGFEGANWRRPVRPVLTLLLTAGLIAVLLATLQVRLLRDFFEFVQPDVADWILVSFAVVVALVGQYLLSRYWPQIVDAIIARPKGEQLPRGRPV